MTLSDQEVQRLQFGLKKNVKKNEGEIYELTFSKPMLNNCSFSSLIDTLFLPPTFMPRNKSTYFNYLTSLNTNLKGTYLLFFFKKL